MTELVSKGTQEHHAPPDLERRLPAAGTPTSRRGLILGLAGLGTIFLLGLAVPTLTDDPFYLGLLVDGAILSLTALGLGFLARRLGLMSLGHAAFFGIAAYTVAAASTHGGLAPLPSFLLGLAVGTAAAVVIGALVVRTTGMAFLMLTLALGQAVYLLSIQAATRPLTGGYDGLQTTWELDDKLFGIDAAMLLDSGQFWIIAWSSLVLGVLVVWLVGRGRFGLVLEGIRENEERMRFSGYGTFWPRLGAFVVSGMLSALAGALFALHAGYVSPDILGFIRAGDSLIAALVGGIGYLLGPAVGAFAFVYAQSAFATSGNLPLYTGLSLIVVVMFFRGGLTGVVVLAGRRIRRMIGGKAR